jgi:TatD DNase family protein
MFVDSHCHIYFDGLAERLPELLEHMREQQVTHALLACVDLETYPSLLALAEQHDNLFASVGVHPDHEDMREPTVAELVELARHPKVVAIGETGLDYYWDRVKPAVQQEHFRRHLELAKRLGLPLMIHDRDAHADVLRILLEQGAPRQVVFHAFSGDEAMARTCVEAGYFLSIPGVVSFANAPGLRAAVGAVPAANLLVETDAPFLTPHPFRGRPNAPYLLPYTLRALALATRLSVADLCETTMRNGARAFGARFASS